MKKALSALLFVAAAFVMTGCATQMNTASTLADANVQMTQAVASVTEVAAATGLVPADKAAAAVVATKVATKVAAGVASVIQSDVNAVASQVKAAKAAAAQVKAAASAPAAAASAPAVEIAPDPAPAAASEPTTVPVASAPATMPTSDGNAAILAGITAVAVAGAGLFSAWKKKYPTGGGQS